MNTGFGLGRRVAGKTRVFRPPLDRVPRPFGSTSRVAFTIVEALAIRLRSLRVTPIFLSRELSRIDNLTMYVLLYPLESIHPGATEKSIRIWCSPDRAKAWSDAVLKGINATAPATCRHPIETLKKFAEARNIFATPTMVFEDGRRIAGAIPAADIEKYLFARH